MIESPFQLATLDVAHDRSSFDSGSEPLNRYLREQVTQDVRRRVAAYFVCLGKRNDVISTKIALAL